MADNAYQIVGEILDTASERVHDHLLEDFCFIGELLDDINNYTFHLSTKARFEAEKKLGRDLGYNQEEANRFVSQIDNQVVLSAALEKAIGVMLERVRQALVDCGFTCVPSREFLEAITGEKIKEVQ